MNFPKHKEDKYFQFLEVFEGLALYYVVSLEVK